MAPNFASPMAHSYISMESMESSFLPAYCNMEGVIVNTSNEGYPVESTIHFIEDESPGRKFSRFLQYMWRTVVVSEFLI